MQKLKETLTYLWRFFCWKGNSPSKTAFFLSLATFVAIFLWFVQSLFAGLEIKGFAIPEFNYIATTGMLITLAGLYLANHKIKTKASVDEIEFEIEEEEDEEEEEE